MSGILAECIEGALFDGMQLPGILGEVFVTALVGKLVIPGDGGNEVFLAGAGESQPFCQLRNGIGTGKQIIFFPVG